MLNVGSKVYKTVKVTAIEPSGIRFSHADGAGRAKFEELDEATRKKFNYDPAKATEFEQKKEIARLEEKLAMTILDGAAASMTGVSGRVQSITDKGVLLTDAKMMRDKEMVALPDDAAFLICPTAGVVNGQRIDQVAWPRGHFEFTTVLGARRKVKCFTTSIDDYKAFIRDPSAQPK